jgi:hypothetical protein
MSTVAVASMGGVGDGDGVSVGRFTCELLLNDKRDGCVGVYSNG